MKILPLFSHPAAMAATAVLLLTTASLLADEHLDVLQAGNDTYTNVTVTTITATDIYFTYPGGMSNAKLKNLSPELQKHFAFDPDKAAAAEKLRAQANNQYHQQVLHQTAADNVPEGLDIGQRFPRFYEVDLTGKTLSVSDHLGHVTMIDFWATWCPPCRAEMPNVIATYGKYHDQGFDIIGISLDDDLNALQAFTQKQGMPWQQYFDGLVWNNNLVKRYGVNSIPMDYLLDRNGVIIGKALRGAGLGNAVAKALAAK